MRLKYKLKTKNEKYLCYVLKTPFFFCLCIFVYVCVWMHTHVYASVHERQRTTSGVIPYTIFLKKDLSFVCSLTNRLV